VRGPRFPSCSIPTHLFATQNNDPDGDTPLRAGPPRPNLLRTPPVSHPHALSTPVHVETCPTRGSHGTFTALEPAPLPSPSKINPLRRRLRFYSAPKPPVLFLLSVSLAACSERLREESLHAPPPLSPPVRSLFTGSGVRCVSAFVLRRRCRIWKRFSQLLFFLKAMEWLCRTERWFVV
jgi:hypothetical protein